MGLAVSHQFYTDDGHYYLTCMYRIFNPGKFMSNRALLTILSFMIFFDMLITIIWTISDPFQFQFVEYKVKNGQTYDIIIDQGCILAHGIEHLWIGTVLTYKISLLVVIIVLSVLTHQIPNQSFSTTLLLVFSYVYFILFVIEFSI